MAKFKINPFYIIVLWGLYPIVNGCVQKHSDKEYYKTANQINNPVFIPIADTAYVLDSKFYYGAALTKNRIYMVTKSGRDIIQDINNRQIGYFVQPGDTVILDYNNEIITSLRHQRMKDKFVPGR